MFKKTAIAAGIALCAQGAWATNGMNLEGYGPVATGMGGASMAYDNGTAALMNNPATLTLLPGGSRLDLALGMLGPNIESRMSGFPPAPSSADAFYMPAVGYVTKRGSWTTGVGMFAQGGMGTEYSGSSFMSAGSGQPTRSEVGVGRVLIPVGYDVSNDFRLAGSIDYVWAGMDLQMAMSGGQMMDMFPAALNPFATQTYGSLGGSMLNTLAGFMGGAPGQISAINWGYFDFSNTSRFTGEAKGTGYAYHSKTKLDDLETSGATVSMNVAVNGAGNVTLPVTGKITVKDFQWPATYGIGMAYQASDEWMLVADYKRIGWAAVMKDFKMTFEADAVQAGGPMASAVAGTTLDATLFQNWKDQNVFMLGAAYKASGELTLRMGVNIANNPIPDQYMNPLFPATIRNHVTVGAGYAFSKAASFDMSLTVAPEVRVTNGSGVTTSHSQTNFQLMYSHRY
jgi:long-chain fatty acid transport protein